MTIYTQLTIILPKAAQALAQGLCVAAAGEAGIGMFVTGLNAKGTGAATHYISTGAVEAKFAAILPLSTIDGEEVTRSAGDVEAVIQLAKDAGQTVDAKTIGGFFAALDVSEQNPFEAMARLGLQIIAE